MKRKSASKERAHQSDSEIIRESTFQRQPVNRSTGSRFHSTPILRLNSSNRQLPTPSARKLSPSPVSRQAHQGLAETSALTVPPKSVRPLAGPGKPLALRLPTTHQATAPVSPGRQKSEQRDPAPRPGWDHLAALHYGQIARVAPKYVFYPLSTRILSASPIIRESEIPKLCAMAWAVSKFGLRFPRSNRPMYV